MFAVAQASGQKKPRSHIKRRKCVCVAVLTFPRKQLLKDIKTRSATYFRSTGQNNWNHQPELNHGAMKKKKTWISSFANGNYSSLPINRLRAPSGGSPAQKQQSGRRSRVTHPAVARSPCGSIRSAASSSAWSRGPAAPRSARQRP